MRVIRCSKTARAGPAGRWAAVRPVAGRRLRLACRALQSPEDLQPSPVAPADRALQSLLESGIRGSLACFLSLPLHLNLLEAWHPSAAAVSLGLQAAAPLLLLDAALLLPDGPALAASGGGTATARGRYLSLAGSVLSAAQATTARYSLAGAATGAQRAALAAAAQLSDELLSRGVLFGFAALWVHGRLGEAGLADEALWAGGPGLEAAAKWGMAAALAVFTGLRYSHHAAEQVAALQRQRSSLEGEAASATQRAALARYEPPRDPGAAPLPLPAVPPAEGRFPERRAHVVAMALGSRAVLGAGAAYAAYLASGDNLAASFTAGVALQLGAGALLGLSGAITQRSPEP